MLDSSVNAAESSMTPLTLPSPKEVFCPVEHPGCTQNLDSGMDPEVAPLPKALAAITDLSHAGESTLHRLLCFRLSPRIYPGPQVLVCGGLDVWMWPPSNQEGSVKLTTTRVRTVFRNIQDYLLFVSLLEKSADEWQTGQLGNI